jgi:hypothetical protein
LIATNKVGTTSNITFSHACPNKLPYTNLQLCEVPRACFPSAPDSRSIFRNGTISSTASGSDWHTILQSGRSAAHLISKPPYYLQSFRLYVLYSDQHRPETAHSLYRTSPHSAGVSDRREHIDLCTPTVEDQGTGRRISLAGACAVLHEWRFRARRM